MFDLTHPRMTRQELWIKLQHNNKRDRIIECEMFRYGFVKGKVKVQVLGTVL